MAELRIELLGGFSVASRGRAIPEEVWQRRKTAALFKLLALAPRHRLHREQVMDALWPELPPAAAAANLRKAVYYARHALPGEEGARLIGSVIEPPPRARALPAIRRCIGKRSGCIATACCRMTGTSSG